MTSPLSGENTLDKIIEYCQQHGINTIKKTESPVPIRYNQYGVKVGRFIFEAHRHDTGCGVECHIVDDDENSYQIINTTYWYSRSYTFNESKWEHGAWDNALDAAIKELKEKVKTHKEQIKQASDKIIAERGQKEKERKEKCERLFINEKP